MAVPVAASGVGQALLATLRLLRGQCLDLHPREHTASDPVPVAVIICISVLEEMTVSEFAECVRTLGVQDALLLGGSGDVHMWVQTHEEETIHAQDAGSGVRHTGVCEGVTVNEGHILMAQPRAGGTRVTLGPGQRPLNALLAAFLLRG